MRDYELSFSRFTEILDKSGFIKAAEEFRDKRAQLNADGILPELPPRLPRGSKRLELIEEGVLKLASLGKVIYETPKRDIRRATTTCHKLEFLTSQVIRQAGVGVSWIRFKEDYLFYYDPAERRNREEEQKFLKIYFPKSKRIGHLPNISTSPNLAEFIGDFPEDTPTMATINLATHFYPRADLDLPDELNLAKFVGGVASSEIDSDWNSSLF